jgi:hypothetical protein
MTGVPTRADVVSSFTIIKGALVEETYAIFREWDFSRSKKANLDDVRESNRIGVSSRNWLRDVCKVVNRRFEPGGRDKPLVLLAQAGVDREVWRPLLLWHMTRDEFLLRDFLTNWLFPEFEQGVFRIRLEDVIPYLEDIERRGLTSSDGGWSALTRKRVAAGLLGIADDVGLLRGSITREFVGFHLREESLLYLLHAVREQEGAATRLFATPDWRMYLMSSADLERELLRLHQFKRVEFHRAGSLIELTLPFDSLLAYAESLTS